MIIVAACLVTAVCFAITPARTQEPATLTAEQSEFLLVIPGASPRRSHELVGSLFEMQLGKSTRTIKFNRVKRVLPFRGKQIVLHELLVETATGNFVNLCKLDPLGEGWGFPLRDSSGTLSFACHGGAIAKCAIWGYPPWSVGVIGAPMVDLHKACVRMVRADYAGSGDSATINGELIRFCDRFGIHACEFGQPWTFEAVWGTDGAHCIAEPRLPDRLSLRELFANAPRLQARIGQQHCSNSFNSSRALLLSYFLPRQYLQ